MRCFLVVDVEEVQPCTAAEVRAILADAEKGPNRARWAIALALGLRQGEVLGLRWPDVDLESGLLWVRKSRLRPIYEHGCGGSCGKFAGWCPDRVLVNGEDGDTKSRAGRRAVGLPEQLVDLLREHREEQNRMRQHARQLWEESDRVFTSPIGRPLNPNYDYHQWEGAPQGSWCS